MCELRTHNPNICLFGVAVVSKMYGKKILNNNGYGQIGNCEWRQHRMVCSAYPNSERFNFIKNDAYTIAYFQCLAIQFYNVYHVWLTMYRLVFLAICLRYGCFQLFNILIYRRISMTSLNAINRFSLISLKNFKKNIQKERNTHTQMIVKGATTKTDISCACVWFCSFYLWWTVRISESVDVNNFEWHQNWFPVQHEWCSFIFTYITFNILYKHHQDPTRHSIVLHLYRTTYIRQTK